MSKLTIVDLQHAQELSGADMACTTGGRDCLAAINIGESIKDLGDVFNNLGLTDAANALYARGDKIIGQGCDH